MPDPTLENRYLQTRERYTKGRAAYAAVLVTMALDGAGDVLPGAQRLETEGSINEDGLSTLRIRRVIGTGGSVLYDVAEGHDDRGVEDAIDMIGADFLDVLLDLTGDTYMGHHTIDATDAAAV